MSLRSKATPWLVVGLLVAVPVAFAETPEALFERANDAYASDRFEEALALYREVLDRGVVDPVLEYNVANAEFRLDRLGPAILHYRRAQRMSPTDPEILANLEYALSMTTDSVETPPPPPPVRWMRGLQDRLGPDAQAWTLLALLWLTTALIAWRWARPSGWTGPYGWILAGLLLTMVVVGASWYVTYQRLEGRVLAVVLARAVDVLAGPGETHPTLFTIHEGLTVQVRTAGDSWVQVSLPNGLNGWVPAEAVDRV